jgi:nitrogen fixation NifU-like protein
MSSEYKKFESAIRSKALEVYSETVVDHAQNPRNLGRMDNADGFASLEGSCGDLMEVRLRVKDNTIADIKFMTDGCGTSIASGSMMSELAKGKSLGDAMKIGQQEVLDALNGLPEESEHCAQLATDTLKAAIRDCMALQKEPWKKAYRKE